MTDRRIGGFSLSGEQAATIVATPLRDRSTGATLGQSTRDRSTYP
jgi:hypothetical protein